MTDNLDELCHIKDFPIGEDMRTCQPETIS